MQKTAIYLSEYLSIHQMYVAVSFCFSIISEVTVFTDICWDYRALTPSSS